MNNFRIFLTIFFSILLLSVQAQLGGRYAYSFLEQPVSARISALGSNLAAISDNDINVGFVNPSTINPGLDNQLALNYVNFFDGVNYGTVQYANTFNKAGSFMGTLQFMDYGQFTYADETGTVGGTFGASDLALTIGWGRQLDSAFSIGAAGKMIYSFYEGYNSFGLAVDVAGTYRSKTNWIMSLVARNMGIQLTTYVPSVRDPLPFDLQFAISKRLEHVPFLFQVIYDHIEKWDLTYYDPSNPPGGTDPITGEPVEQSGLSKFGDQLMRHFIFSGEIYLGKNIVLRGGYNYRRRAEMKVVTKPGMVGFSWGVGIRVSKFKINYSRSTYHLVGSPNYLTLTVDLGAFKSDKVVRF